MYYTDCVTYVTNGTNSKILSIKWYLAFQVFYFVLKELNVKIFYMDFAKKHAGPWINKE